jgi:DNA (cytosine-5)-methyltransferase 1
MSSIDRQPNDCKTQVRKIACVDLFCGVGGLTHGLIRGGLEVVAGFDVDENCRYPYQSNNNALFATKDVRNLTAAELCSHFPPGKLRLIAGCAPCQPFSTYTRKGRGQRNGSKWDLLLDFARLVRETQPELVTMENVPQLLEHAVFGEFLSALVGYTVQYEIVECSQFGVPQTRKRFVLLASKLGPIKFISPSGNARTFTVRDAIAHLPAIKAGEANPDDPLHTSSSLSDLNMRRIRASKPGGTWRDWDRTLLAKCHRKKTGMTYPSVYGRMSWDAPAPTITTQCFGFGNGRFGHPEQNRAISLREASILQTFPSGYRFLRNGERVRFNLLGRLIGNAVPVKLGEMIAASLLVHYETIASRKPFYSSERKRPAKPKTNKASKNAATCTKQRLTG